MATLLVRDAAHVETFDAADTVLRDASIFVRDGAIEALGPAAQLPREADRVVDARGCIVIPGLVSTHHHFYQTLTRAVPGTQDVELFDWLVTLYPIWARLTPAGLRSATAIACAELLLSGCTTASDHTYLWPNGCRIDDEIEVAREIGLRFHPARGSMSVGRSQGGLPPDSVVEDEAAILADTRRAIETYHDAARFAMTRIVVAPCSPFSVSPNLMRESIALARSYGVHAHTHLAETLDEERFCIERFGCRPVELAEQLEWLGPDVWHAHMVHPSAAEVGVLGATRTGVAHCATSNMRLGSGIAPVRALVAAGARVGLGVDGSASNDSSHMLDEVRHALLLQRVAGGAKAASAREILRLGTRGGAAVLGRDDIGYLAPGMAADVAGVRLDALALAGGAVHDPLAALVFCRPERVDFTVVNGMPVVEHGRLTTLDLERVIAQHNELARALVNG
ncbi:MAG: 8-oxoguanine deaminase [Candidatus Lustribacter sp.]|jgi:cytosine/adenosine deaminase-related metal-dependent hydrolase